MYLQIIFGSVRVATWSSFWERIAYNALFVSLLVILVISHVGFEGMGLVLIVPVSGHCYLFILQLLDVRVNTL